MSEQVEQQMAGPAGRIRAIVEEVLSGTELYLVEVSVRGRKGSQVVDVFVDSDTTLDVEALASVSREVGFLLETEDVLPGKYNLNVSSPGLDRPLALPRQYRKNIGREVRVRYFLADASEPAEATGMLADVEDEFLVVVEKGREPLRIPLDAVRDARIVLPW